MTGLLLKKFNLTTFKDWQLRAIKALVGGQDALVVQPTGSGKSLCYQFPAIWLKKTTVVLTPTISLMDDQSVHCLLQRFWAHNCRDTSAGPHQLFVLKRSTHHWLYHTDAATSRLFSCIHN